MTSAFRPITHLRHVALAVPDYDRTVEFYKNYWGLEAVANEGGVTFFGTPADPEQYILRVRRAAEQRTDLIAFGAKSTTDVDELAERLGRAQVQLDRKPGPLDTPGGGYGLRFFDPEGRLIEVSANVEQRPYRALEACESIPRKLSHVVIQTPDVLPIKTFYETHLGLRLSDWLGDMMCFLRSGNDNQHHLLGVAKATSVSLNHISFEMRGLDEYLRGTGRLVRAGHDPLWGPGRHGPGDNTFTYFMDPHNNIIEYTTELQKIPDEDNWEPRVFDPGLPETRDQWGFQQHDMMETMLPAMLAQKNDAGLWVPSPV